MTNIKAQIPDKAPSPLALLISRYSYYFPAKGYCFLAIAIVLLAALASINFSSSGKLLLEGEISPRNVIAEHSFLFEDKEASSQRKKMLRQTYPLICDLITMPMELFHKEIRQLLININQAASDEEKIQLQHELSEELNNPVSIDEINALAIPKTQESISAKILPLIEQQLKDGILPDIRMVLPFKDGGLIIRAIGSGEERVHPDIYSIPDLKTVELTISRAIRELNVPNPAKRLFTQAVSRYLRPTVTPNYDLTNARIQHLETSSEPVMHLVQKGEIIIRQGQRVSKEQQMKMQALLQEQEQKFKFSRFFGAALGGLLLSACFFIRSDKSKNIKLGSKDFIFIGLLLTLFAVLPFGLILIGSQIAVASSTFSPSSLAYGVPIVGAASLIAQVFPFRINTIICLLLAFLCAVMSNGGIGLFLYYFIGGVFSSLLTLAATTRRHIFRNLLPLTGGLYILWLAGTLLDGGAHNRFLIETVSVALSLFFSFSLIFGLTPVVESLFGYTTRFRLMELLNLEQPILRELMLNAPGTYHHALIVSNMVEAAAKAVGANSLLCKVGALYHDIGKINKAHYYIENQFHETNPHDKLTPSMSALVLIAHAKQGAELAKQHRLGIEVTDIIRQHHGTSVIRYFYQKALQQKDAVINVEDFSYPGPKPQSKEAGIVMLADVVEASSRTLSDPSSNRLQTHITSMLKNIFAEGQLDKTNLTFADLDTIASIFHKVLLGIFHHRIMYPEKNVKEENGKKDF